MNLIRFYNIVLLIGVFTSISAGPGHCLSRFVGPPQYAIKNSDLIFSGYVEWVKPATDERLHRNRYHFRVVNCWKGNPGDSITIRATGSRDWKQDFQRDIEYLVYIRLGPDSSYMVPSGNTKPMDKAILDRYLLGVPNRTLVDDYEPVTLEHIYSLLNTKKSRDAYRALGNLRSQAREIVPVLLDFVRGYRPGNAVDALSAIGMYGFAAGFSAPELEGIFKDIHRNKPEVRAQALSSLCSVSTNRWVVRTLVYAGLSDQAWEVRRAAVSIAPNIIYAEKQCYRDRMVRKVLALLDDDNPVVRRAAISAVGATELLKRLSKHKIRMMSTRDPDRNIREWAQYILK